MRLRDEGLRWSRSECMVLEGEEDEELRDGGWEERKGGCGVILKKVEMKVE